MKSVIFKSILVFSKKKNRGFYSEFGDRVNIIHGCNTSGKSSLLLSLLYSLGINDVKLQLKEILDEFPVFRLEAELMEAGKTIPMTFVRGDNSICIKYGSDPWMRFNGVNADNSQEHIKYKEFLSELLGFSMQLENKGEFKPAPLEVMLLPYYISQSVGWVYLRKSFSNLDYYKNFKEDYLDYYLGISDSKNRLGKFQLLRELRDIEEKKKFFIKFEQDDESLQLTKLSDESYGNQFLPYLEKLKGLEEEVKTIESSYVLACNELSYCIERKRILAKIKRNSSHANGEQWACPLCNSDLNFTTEDHYLRLQNENDTESEVEKLGKKIKQLQAEIDSGGKNIEKIKKQIERNYSSLKAYETHNVSIDHWIKNKSNVKLIEDIAAQLGKLTITENALKEKLKEYRTESDIEIERSDMNNKFESLFKKNLSALGISHFKEERYLKLYQISAFPCQGTELLQTIMAYHFAFVELIGKTKGLHSFPFMLDAIFKEDIDTKHKPEILDFIGTQSNRDRQTFVSIAESDEDYDKGYINRINTDHFNGKARLIHIGTAKRSFLHEKKDHLSVMIEDTLVLLSE